MVSDPHGLRGTELDMRRYNGDGTWSYDSEADYDHDASMKNSVADAVASGRSLSSDEVRWLCAEAGIEGAEAYDPYAEIRARAGLKLETGMDFKKRATNTLYHVLLIKEDRAYVRDESGNELYVPRSVLEDYEVVEDKEVFITCYNTREGWASKKMAEQFYTEAAFSCEGAERDRYMEVLEQLFAGRIEVFDTPDYEREQQDQHEVGRRTVSLLGDTPHEQWTNALNVYFTSLRMNVQALSDDCIIAGNYIDLYKDSFEPADYEEISERLRNNITAANTAAIIDQLEQETKRLVDAAFAPQTQQDTSLGAAKAAQKGRAKVEATNGGIKQ